MPGDDIVESFPGASPRPEAQPEPQPSEEPAEEPSETPYPDGDGVTGD